MFLYLSCDLTLILRTSQNKWVMSTKISNRRKLRPIACVLELITDKKNSNIIYLRANRSFLFDDVFYNGKVLLNIPIVDNIKKIDTKSIDNVIVTMELKKPPINIRFQKTSNYPKIHTFLYRLKILYDDRANGPMLKIGSLNPGYVDLSKLQLTSLDRRLLRLTELKSLNLSYNKLEEIPEELGSLPMLEELKLEGNKLAMRKTSNWKWLNGKNIQKNLQFLDLSENDIAEVPEELSEFKSLWTLWLSKNPIKILPFWLQNLPLEDLRVSEIYLTSLPGFILHKVGHLSITGIIFRPPLDNVISYPKSGIQTLKALAAHSIVDNKITYAPEIIPQTLVNYVKNSPYCLCGKLCRETYIRGIIYISAERIQKWILFYCSCGNSFSCSCKVPVDYIFCSVQCYNYYPHVFSQLTEEELAIEECYDNEEVVIDEVLQNLNI